MNRKYSRVIFPNDISIVRQRQQSFIIEKKKRFWKTVLLVHSDTECSHGLKTMSNRFVEFSAT